MNHANEALAELVQAQPAGRDTAISIETETNHRGKWKENEVPHSLKTRESSLDPWILPSGPEGTGIR